MLEPIHKIQRIDETDNGVFLRPIEQKEILAKQEQIIARINLLSAMAKAGSLDSLGLLPGFLTVPPGEETATQRLLSENRTKNKRKEKL